LAVPAEATIRRTLARLDADALAGTIGAWLADPDRRNAAPGRRAVAVDGKTLRGARTQAVMPAAAPAGGDGPTSRQVLAQRQVAGAPRRSRLRPAAGRPGP
jgi:hypothetical protein